MEDKLQPKENIDNDNDNNNNNNNNEIVEDIITSKYKNYQVCNIHDARYLTKTPTLRLCLLATGALGLTLNHLTKVSLSNSASVIIMCTVLSIIAPLVLLDYTSSSTTALLESFFKTSPYSVRSQYRDN